jgi:hypothetical protein
MDAAVASPRSPSALGRWRTLVTYVGVVAVDTWLLFVLLDVQMGREIVNDAALGTSRFLASALTFLPLVALVLLPAAVSRESSHRVGRRRQRPDELWPAPSRGAAGAPSLPCWRAP